MLRIRHELLRNAARSSKRSRTDVANRANYLPSVPYESKSTLYASSIMWSTAERMYDLVAIKEFLAAHGYDDQQDNTRYKRGSLWVITDRDHRYDKRFFDNVNTMFDSNFIFAPSGSGATSGRSAWFWVPGHQPGMWLCPGVLED